MRRGYAAVIGNVGKVVALITVMIAALVIFTEVSFADLCTERFTSTLIFMLIASYLMYFSMSDAGEKLAEESEEYSSCESKFLSIKSAVRPMDITALRDYLTAYSEGERKYRIESYLVAKGFSPTEFFDWCCKRERISDREKRAAFIRAKRIKAVTPGISSIMTDGRTNSKGELYSPEKSKIFLMLLKMIPTTVCMIFSASVILSTKDGLTASVVLDGLVKLSSLVIIGFKGYTGGFNYIRFSKIPWIETKTRILEGFLSQAERTANTTEAQS